MRVRALFVVCSLAFSVVAVGASPAGAIHCRGAYLDAIGSPPPPPPADQLVVIGDSIVVDGNLAVGYGLALASHFSDATTAYVKCQVAEIGGVVGNVLGSVACTAASPGVANLTGKNPHARYVTVSGFTVEIHHSVLLADANAVLACWIVGQP